MATRYVGKRSTALVIRSRPVSAAAVAPSAGWPDGWLVGQLLIRTISTMTIQFLLQRHRLDLHKHVVSKYCMPLICKKTQWLPDTTHNHTPKTELDSLVSTRWTAPQWQWQCTCIMMFCSLRTYNMSLRTGDSDVHKDSFASALDCHIFCKPSSFYFEGKFYLTPHRYNNKTWKHNIAVPHETGWLKKGNISAKYMYSQPVHKRMNQFRTIQRN